ncbi:MULTISPECIES: flagellar motor switch phosphatase FliY [Bacillus]|jgi:flagellar motor switch protein FliN/FliY|uniref:Flagellar motor switch protein FliN n=2 Tax=Bacillus amyloliquefaciens TaxID=1390 RepID=A0A9P1JH47_BACAS|nr:MULTISPECIES: flagellar motor switch phosphatase FliY [Bacillus amyloliquefaciens group]AIW33636.1 flagellar motor switch protein FliN [Bacillus subtilis]AEB23965.1 flagellar motor switch protein [Bacillus amyloliquefaciens TA208]AEB63332.1 flagellar motor switching and energizing phosphatase [Bacillus amyloliquefaciens LL3]AEK88961.1 flagellar motor switch protein [Bacillus amyloliquefaciens XH7]ARW38908.1 Flagellar motor switch phosphatase FliY [Bacillus amyloliquefaciens]
MNNRLSQDEIDALLNGTGSHSEDTEQPQEANLSELERDAIGEIGNISFGSSATALSTLLNQKVDITTPSVTVISKSKISDEFPHPYVAIEVNYTEGFDGSNLLVVEQSDAAIIADLMIGGDGQGADPSLGEIHLSAVQEAMNQMMGSAATSMSTVFSKKIDISPPRVELLDVTEEKGTDRIPEDDLLVKVSFRLKVGELIDSSIMQLYPITFAKDLIAELMDTDQPEADETVSEPRETYETPQPEPAIQQEPQAKPELPKRQGTAKKAAPVQVAPVEFQAFDQNAADGHGSRNNLDMLMDIPLSVTVELGRTKRSVKEILELSAGSIIELDKLAGEPVDILVNQRIVAKGEVVVIEENFGVRVTDILSQADRLNNLK